MRRLTCLFALLPAIACADPCAFSAPRDFDVDAAGIRTLVLAPGADDVDVEGVAGLERIKVRAKACASSEDRLADLVVDRQPGGEAFAITSRARSSEFRLFGSSYAYIDYRLRVPARLVIGIRASSGNANVRNVAALDFDTASGNLVADAITGSIGVRTASGDVGGRGSGSIGIRGSASGDIAFADVRGDVKVERSASGDLAFSDVGGNVEIGSVGSGDVSLHRVAGNVEVGAIGSGDVEAVGIGGDLLVRATGSGGVTHRDVRGTVSIPVYD